MVGSKSPVPVDELDGGGAGAGLRHVVLASAVDGDVLDVVVVVDPFPRGAQYVPGVVGREGDGDHAAAVAPRVCGVLCLPRRLRIAATRLATAVGVGDAVDVDDDAGELEPSAAGQGGGGALEPGAHDVEAGRLRRPRRASRMPRGPPIWRAIRSCSLRVGQRSPVEDVGLPALQPFDDGGLDRVGAVLQRLVAGLDLLGDLLLHGPLLAQDAEVLVFEVEPAG